jgi:hypothetical protein
MHFQIFNNNKEDQFIHIELTKDDIKYLLKNESLTEFDSTNKIRIEIIDETKDYPLDGNHN